jgi:hypothetical protein
MGAIDKNIRRMKGTILTSRRMYYLNLDRRSEKMGINKGRESSQGLRGFMILL